MTLDQYAIECWENEGGALRRLRDEINTGDEVRPQAELKEPAGTSPNSPVRAANVA